MSERDLCIKVPFLCGLPEDQARRESKINELLFDYEAANPGSEFRKLDSETQWGRLSYGFKWVKELTNRAMINKALYAWELLAYRATCAKGFVDEKWAAELRRDETNYPDVAEILTVDQASTQSFWNGG